MNNKTKFILSLIAIVLTLVTCLGITYALWSASFTQSTTNNLVAGCFSITFSDGDAISIANAFPITDEESKAKPSYDVTINNTCTVNAKYDIRIESLNTTTMDKNYIKASVDNKNINILNNFTRGVPKIGSTTDAYIVYTGIINAGATKTHSIREWIDYSTTTQIQNNDRLDTRITIDMNATEYQNLHDAILAQYGGASSITEASAGIYSSVSTTSTNLMHKTNDDYGVSYYYRGAKTLLKNNILFAGFQWKIVRINGDGSIRLIYNGTEAQFIASNASPAKAANTMNSTGVNTKLNGMVYDFNTEYDDNKYVGYMFGGANGSASTSRNQATTNETNSSIKTIIDNWYATNILSQGTSVTSKISDTLFCNDRQLQSEVGGGSTGTGFGTSATTYAAYYRLLTNKTPTLMCGLKNDRFTVSDTAKGNGALTYPVGLITADEASLAGGVYNTTNSTYYLYTNLYFWLLSPSINVGIAVVWGMNDSGSLNGHTVYSTVGARASINLSSGTQVTGTGTATDPFRVV